MTTGPAYGIDDVPEADAVEQQQSAGFEEEQLEAQPDDRIREASDGDLAESAIVVELDEEDDPR